MDNTRHRGMYHYRMATGTAKEHLTQITTSCEPYLALVNHHAAWPREHVPAFKIKSYFGGVCWIRNPTAGTLRLVYVAAARLGAIRLS